MKPTTKLEKYVCQLAGTLNPLTDKQISIAQDKCFYHFAIRNGHSLFCSECGHVWKAEDTSHKRAVCPCCGKTLSVQESKKRKFTSVSALCVTLRRKDFQVFRFFQVIKKFSRNNKAEYDVTEVIQQWCDAEGKKTILARNKKPMSSYFLNPWDYSSPLSIKKNAPYSYGDYYYLMPSHTIVQSVLPILKRNGFRGYTHGYTPSNCIRVLMSSSMHETLFKAHQYAAFYYFSVNNIKDYWASIKIAIRNKYLIKDASAWKDLVDSLQACGMDVHNPKYVCPVNFKAAHDYWYLRAERIRKKKQLKEQYELAIRQEQSFLDSKSRFFGILLNSKDISIHVLSSIKEYMEEGTCMHHCVFANRYYLKDSSLILSATDKENNRLATIELSLEDFSIIQCRADFNKVPPMEKKIKSLIMRNIKLFKTAAA